MASKQATVDYLVDQIAEAGFIRYQKMFGEYAIYCNDKVVGFVCDDQLYIKPTDEGRNFLGDPEEAPAYPGSKLYFRISPDQWEDREFMIQLINVTVSALPLPKEKKKK